MAGLLVNQGQLMSGFDVLGRHRTFISKFQEFQEAHFGAGEGPLIGQGNAEQERQRWIARIMPSFAAGLYSARWRSRFAPTFPYTTDVANSSKPSPSKERMR